MNTAAGGYGGVGVFDTVTVRTGFGGSSQFGQGGTTGATASLNGSIAGTNGSGYGAGGGGAGCIHTVAAQAGGNGTQGVAIFTEYL